MKKIIISTLLMGLLVSCTQAFDNESIALENYTFDKVYTKEEALEDVDFAMEKLKGHIYIEDTFPEEVQKEYEEVVGDFGEEVTELEIWHGVSRIYNEMNTSHLFARYTFGDMVYILPMEFEYKGDTLFMIKEDVRFVIKSLGGYTVEEIYENFDKITSANTKGGLESEFNLLKSREYLSLLGIDVSKKIGIEYLDENGKTTKEYFEFEGLLRTEVKNINRLEGYYKYDIYEDANVGVFRFDFFSDSGQIYEEITDGLDLFFEEVREKDIDNVAIDLRRNDGGYVAIGDYILANFGITEYNVGEEKSKFSDETYKIDDYKLRSVSRRAKDIYEGNLYVLISNYTYSQSVVFSAIVQDNDFGYLIGTEPGELSTVTGYTDSSSYYSNLPNSKLIITIPSKSFKRPDRTIEYDELRPDYEVEDSDLALEKLFEVVE